jgi:hypothetical protein
MSETGMPSSLPVLGHGKHRDPARGACFMEYTSLLAGEAFSDAPGCVDPELAAVLRGANDLLADAQRPLLLPFLGRAIGLVVSAPDGRPAGRVLRVRRKPPADASAVVLERLHRSVAERFIQGVGVSADDGRYRRYARVRRLFWDLMSEPSPVVTSREYATRLIERLELLHVCYEQALDQLGVPRRKDDVDVARPAPVPAG